MTSLNLIDEHARMGKISNNLEKHGDSDVITGFTLPLELRITRGQLQELMGEAFDAAIWVQSAVSGGGSFVGADWTVRVLPLVIGDETYVEVAAVLGLGGRELEFADSKVSKIELLAFWLGGITVMKCHLYVRPGIGTENLLLQEYQEHEVAVSMTQGKLRVKADKAQQNLPLVDPNHPAVIVNEATKSIANLGDPPPTHDHPSLQIVDCHCGKLDDGVATPPDERERAQARERMIARQIESDRATEAA